jgi:hypothetical protein
MEPRRFFLSRLAGLPLLAMAAAGGVKADLSNYGAKYGNPAIFVSLVEWADKVITE